MGGGKGRPPKGWMNGMKDAVEGRGMTVENARVVCQNRSEWRTIVMWEGFFLEDLA